MAEVRRQLYTHDQLLPLIRPRSVAVVGASGGDTGFGNQALKRMQEAAFTGPLYAVHPKFGSEAAPDGIAGLPSIAALPEPVDCVLVATPAAAVLDVARGAATKGCRSSIIFSAGFGETADGSSAESELTELARQSGMRIGGPNTAGVLNYRDGLALTFVSDLRMDLPTGNLGIVAQSAGLATHLGHRRHRGAGVSYTLTTGNSADVNAFDYVNFLLDDDSTDVVLLAIEGVTDPDHLREIGERSSALGKPVLVLKAGRTDRGGHASMSHTGSLAGSHEVFLDAAAEAGLQVFRHPDELLDTGLLFARWADRPYRTGGVAVLTTMGGPGVIAADAADDHRVDLPDPSPRTSERLAELIPDFAASANPFDTTAFPSDDVLTDVLLTLSGDKAYAAVVMLLATTTGAATAQRPTAVTAAAEQSDTPVAAVWLSSWLDGPGSEILDAATRVPVFRSADTCFRAVRAWTDWHRGLDTRRSPARTEIAVSAGIGDIATTLDTTPPGLLDEAHSRDLMSACGVPVPRGHLAGSAEETAEAGEKIGWPVAVKIVSADIAHKVAVGGVELGVADEAAATAAYERIVDAVRKHHPDTDPSTVLVAEMVRSRCDEFMCGLTRDPVFGPVVVVGAGGSAVEQTRDVARSTVPLTAEKARDAVRRLRAHARLVTRDPVSAARLERELVTVMGDLAALAEATPRIAEVDLNPVVLDDHGDLVALDALVVLR